MTDQTMQKLEWPLAAVLVTAIALLSPAPSRAQERPAWWDGRWRYRKLVRLPDARARPVAGRVWVHVRREADHGGRDLRVVAPDGREVPFGVLHATPEGRYLLAFETRGTDGFYSVYFGNPRAERVEHRPPAGGLIYETRPMPRQARAETWQRARATMERAGPPHGADYWPHVFDAHNPFGPSSEYIAIYRGHIRCPEAGTYRFATVSDDSSFLLIDGQPVTQWVGRHDINRGRRGEHSGSVQLRPGLHEFLYVHFVTGGAGRCAAAWIPPGKEWWRIIPPGAFRGPMEAVVHECEQYGQPVCADFGAVAADYYETGSARMTAVEFSSRSTAAGGIIVAYQWDFGDGQGSADPRPRHVYLAPGVYNVSLTVTSSAGQRAPCVKQVRVEPVRGEVELTHQKAESFLEEVSAYRLGALPTPCLLGAWRLFRHLEREQMALEAALQLDRRAEELQPSVRHETAMELARHYRDRERRYELAEQYFRTARDSAAATSPRLEIEARFALADLRFHHLNDAQGARREYVELRADLSPARSDRRRLALIRIGDTYRREGKVSDARRAYREAEGETVDAPDGPEAVVKGALFRQVEAHLKNGEGERALDALEELLWYFPTLRLEGRPALLRVRAELLQGDFREARERADVYLNFARDPNYVPAVHVEAAEACIELGLIAEARRHYRTVLDDFPESACAQDAGNGLYRLRQ